MTPSTRTCHMLLHFFVSSVDHRVTYSNENPVKSTTKTYPLTWKFSSRDVYNCAIEIARISWSVVTLPPSPVPEPVPKASFTHCIRDRAVDNRYQNSNVAIHWRAVTRCSAVETWSQLPSSYFYLSSAVVVGVSLMSSWNFLYFIIL